MARLDVDSSLNEVIKTYLKNKNLTETLSVFGKKCDKEGNIERCQEFMNYLKEKEAEEEEDDLGFEINFGANEPKIDWVAVYSDKKIYCHESNCDFFGKLDTDDLMSHLIDTHKYGTFKCEYKNVDCKFVGFSEVSFNF